MVHQDNRNKKEVASEEAREQRKACARPERVEHCALRDHHQGGRGLHGAGVNATAAQACCCRHGASQHRGAGKDQGVGKGRLLAPRRCGVGRTMAAPRGDITTNITTDGGPPHAHTQTRTHIQPHCTTHITTDARVRACHTPIARTVLGHHIKLAAPGQRQSSSESIDCIAGDTTPHQHRQAFVQPQLDRQGATARSQRVSKQTAHPPASTQPERRCPVALTLSSRLPVPHTGPHRCKRHGTVHALFETKRTTRTQTYHRCAERGWRKHSFVDAGSTTVLSWDTRKKRARDC